MSDLFEQAAEAIVEADAEAAREVAETALEEGIAPGEIMAQGFVAGIGQVGEAFESGELFLPELMMSAQAMEAAMGICNAALGTGAAAKQGRIVIGTVQGDVHDIGKAIVIAYLKANSYEVTDLGRDVPNEAFLAAAQEKDAQVIGMSALLTTTMEEQKKLVRTLVESGRREEYKVVVGGAPATQRWADAIGADAYAEDASDGVRKIDGLLDQA